MKRVIIICEGPTEQAFCNTTLAPVLFAKGICVNTPLIKHSKGGIVKWEVLKKQIEIHLKSDKNAYVTTFIDYYGIYLKYQFPSWQEAEGIPDKNMRINKLEEGMLSDILFDYQHRFIPYLQLHEFESLLFSDIQCIYSQIPSNEIIGRDELIKTINDNPNPETINNHKETSPSHRLERIICGYNKIVYGDVLSEAIGLPILRQKNPRFDSWITKLESLN